VQLEALAAKKPVVNFNIKTGVPQVSLNNVTGKTFEIDDLEAFSKLFLSENKAFQNLNKFVPNIEHHLDINFSKVKIEKRLERIYLGLIGYE
jgi:glycosyltransferase involved in cell wall biosynthesis